MRLLLLATLAGLLATGCVPRSRGGGGGSGSTATLPSDVDTDGDGLSDADEEERGTDSENPDTDGDGYRDGDEVANGSDPADEDDGIFAGGFPFNPDIAGCSEDFGGDAAAGDALPCAAFETQFGEAYNLWHLQGSAERLVIDNSATWCGPCLAMAAWLDGDDNGFVSPEADSIREAVWAGEVRWLTALYQDGSGSPADGADLEDWYAAYPTENVVVVGDGDEEILGWIGPPGIPSLSLVDLQSMEMLIVDDTTGVLTALFASL